MLNIHSITSRFFPSTSPAPILTIGPGSKIEVETLCYGKQIGIIQYITDSPYYGEAGVQRAYVVGNGWTDYVLIDDLDFEESLDRDPDYLLFLQELAQSELAD